jgi:hypothetical protein
MAQLPDIHSATCPDLNNLSTHWRSMLNPALAQPMLGVNIIPNIQLAVGPNVINHKLGQQMQGWFVTDIQGMATIYRSAPMNSTTLTLTSSAAVTINLGVF